MEKGHLSLLVSSDFAESTSVVLSAGTSVSSDIFDSEDSDSLEDSELESSTTFGEGTPSLLVSSDFAESTSVVLSAGTSVSSDIFDSEDSDSLEDSELESSTTFGEGTPSLLVSSDFAESTSVVLSAGNFSFFS